MFVTTFYRRARLRAEFPQILYRTISSGDALMSYWELLQAAPSVAVVLLLVTGVVA